MSPGERFAVARGHPMSGSLSRAAILPPQASN
jgi:hypothetical protein